MKKAFVSSDELGFGYRWGCTVHALLVLYKKLCKLSSVSLFYMHAPGMLWSDIGWAEDSAAWRQACSLCFLEKVSGFISPPVYNLLSQLAHICTQTCLFKSFISYYILSYHESNVKLVVCVLCCGLFLCSVLVKTAANLWYYASWADCFHSVDGDGVSFSCLSCNVISFDQQATTYIKFTCSYEN